MLCSGLCNLYVLLYANQYAFLSSVCHTSKEHRPMPLPLKLLLRLVCLLGGVILSIWGGFKKRRYTIGLSVLMGVSNMLRALPPDAFLVFVVCCTVMGISAPFYGVQNAIFQKRSNQSIHRVFSTDKRRFPHVPFGLVISGPLAERLELRNGCCGIGIIIVALAVFLLPGLKRPMTQ